MTASLFHTNSHPWDSPYTPTASDRSHLHAVALSVAEAALKSGPNSPSCNSTMADLMTAPPLDEEEWEVNAASTGTWPRAKPKRATSFACGGRPLWQVVEHAKERRQNTFPSPLDSPSVPSQSYTQSFMPKLVDQPEYQDVVLTTHSADPSPIETAFSQMSFTRNVPRLSGRDFADRAEKRASAAAHARTQSDVHKSPSQVLRSQASSRVNRLPSLAQIQAKMNRAGSIDELSTRRGQMRSDSLESVDSDGPRTPTDETSFSFDLAAASNPASPARESRLAPFLRERTSGRLARPKSMPPMYNDYDFSVDDDDTPDMIHSPTSSSRQDSLPSTPQSKSRRANRTWSGREEITLVITPPRHAEYAPTSPTESVQSTASSIVSLPIITCTPAVEQDSDEESEGDVIVFSGECDDEEDRREREKRGLEMRSRLLRRASKDE